MLTCVQKLTSSQLNLPYGTKQKIMKKLKAKNGDAQRNGPVVKSVESVQIRGWKGVYGGKDL